jgi:alpha-1,2-mannosyltransferase
MPAAATRLTETSSDRPMTRRQRGLVVAAIVAAVILGGVVVWRSAFMHRRMTDLGCYLRGAWAVRAGADLYAVTDDNGWHYNYPPFLAILIGPLADAPPGQPPVTALPYPASVVVWYLASLVALLASVHLLAGAVEHGRPSPPRPFGRRWWAVRIAPVLILSPAIGRTLARGQVNMFVLVLLAGWIAGVVRGRRLTAGMCLALAACIKVIPALLLIHPLWRRDRRVLAGAAIGLAIALVILPAAVCGPTAAIEQATQFAQVTLGPGLGLGGDSTRFIELISPNRTDSQSIMTALHNLAHPHPWYRPMTADPWVRAAHWVTAACLLGATLLLPGRREPSTRDELCFTGALVLVMALASPVCHMHYFVFALPLVMGVWAEPRPRFATVAVAAFVFANCASVLPIDLFRQYGLTTAAALGLWATSLRAIPSQPSADGAGRVALRPAA